MSERVLVAGLGNLLRKDAGFGLMVARRLATERATLPADVAIADAGIRGIDLMFRLLEPLQLLVVADVASRGGQPGTLYVLEPDLEEQARLAVPDGRGLDLSSVLAAVRALGAHPPPVRLVGCEPADVGEGIGLSAAVARAVGPALDLVRELLLRPAAPDRAAEEVEP